MAKSHGAQLREGAIVDVQIRATDRRARDTQDGVAGVLNARVSYLLDADVFGFVKNGCSHGFPFRSTRTLLRLRRTQNADCMPERPDQRRRHVAEGERLRD